MALYHNFTCQIWPSDDVEWRAQRIDEDGAWFYLHNNLTNQEVARFYLHGAAYTPIEYVCSILNSAVNAVKEPEE